MSNLSGATDVTLEATDIEIGQVELKDSDSTSQANIKAANTARTTATKVVATQPIDAAGAVLSTSALATSAKQLADGHNVVVSSGTVTTVSTLTGGGVADNGADSGNPVKVGGKYNLTPQTYADGDRADLQADVAGRTIVTMGTQLEYGQDSVTNYPVGCTMTEVDLATDADVVVSAVPCVLLGLYANVVFSAHAVNIIDNVTTKLILPASTAAGTKIDCHSATFATNLSVNSDDAATGKLVVFWRAL